MSLCPFIRKDGSTVWLDLKEHEGLHVISVRDSLRLAGVDDPSLLDAGEAELTILIQAGTRSVKAAVFMDVVDRYRLLQGATVRQ